MRRGVVGIRFDDTSAVAAPESGVAFGVGQGGSLALRLFRLTGTRVVLAARVLPAQLLAVRAAAGGTPVQVVTSRPQLWEPLLPRDAGHAVGPSDVRGPGGGPSLVIDDRPAESRGPDDVRSWQCRLDVRTQWSPTMLSSFAHADLTVFGAIPLEFVTAVARAFAIDTDAAQPLARLDSGSFGVLRRGRIEFVSLDPTAAEGHLLAQARGAGVPAALPAG